MVICNVSTTCAESKCISYSHKCVLNCNCVCLSKKETQRKKKRERAVCAVMSISIPAVSKLTFSTCQCHEQMKGNVNVCRWRVWGPLASRHAVRVLRNRAGEGRDPWDGGTELRKELLCSHLNRDRCWRRREVGQTKGRETERGNRRGRRLRVYSMCTLCSFKYSMSELTLHPPLLTSALINRLFPRGLLHSIHLPAEI